MTKTTKMVSRWPQMRRSTIGAILVAFAQKFPGPLKRGALSLATKAEGGQMTSTSLRRYLRDVHEVEVGNYSYGSLLQPGNADRGLKIGRFVSIGPDVRRFGASHPVGLLSMHPYWYNPALGVVGKEADVRRDSCVIEDDAWIGSGVIILPGCKRIGIGAVVGAGTILTRDVPDFAVVVGNPGRVSGTRLDQETRTALIERRPWALDPEAAMKEFHRIANEIGDSSLFPMVEEQ